MALATLRKKRAEIDPKVLSKIREKIFSNPAVMKALGIDQEDVPKEAPPKAPPKPPKATPKAEPKVAPFDVKGVKLSEDEKNLLGHVQAIMKKQEAQERAKQKSSNPEDRMEKIDREKNLETISKLMKIRPDYKQ